MEIVADRLDWTQFDEEKWNNFLLTETGKRLIPKVLETTPPLLAGGDTNAILIRAGEHRGIQLAISQLISMAHSTPQVKTEVVSDSYPALDDDKKWNDGLKFEDSQTTPKIPDII
jgi:hypothetical protein